MRDVEGVEEGMWDSLVFPLFICTVGAEFRFLNSLIALGMCMSFLSTHSLSELGIPSI